MKGERRVGLLFILPWLIGLVVFKIYPFITSFILSFTNYNMISIPKFVGIDNYLRMFSDPAFKQSIIATFRYGALTVPTQLLAALFIAFILNFKLKGIGFYRTAFYIPTILGGNVAIAVLWRFLFSTSGLVNQVIGVFGIEPIGWFSTISGTMINLTLLKVWQFGGAMIIFLAALKEIPQELYEAASIDGASKTRTFFKVTIPLITPTIFFNLVMGVIGALQEFNTPFLITGGGPLKSTYLAGLLIYDNAYRKFDMGYSSTLAWALFIIIMIFTSIIFKSSSYWVYYSDGGEK